MLAASLVWFIYFVLFLCFQAFSAFFYIHSFLQRITGITVSTPSELEEATRALCTMTYNEVIFLSLFCLCIICLCAFMFMELLYSIWVIRSSVIFHEMYSDPWNALGVIYEHMWIFLNCNKYGNPLNIYTFEQSLVFWLQMLTLAPDQKSRLQDYCPASVFVEILMLRGYNFDKQSFPHISFQKKVRALLSLSLYWYDLKKKIK